MKTNVDVGIKQIIAMKGSAAEQHDLEDGKKKDKMEGGRETDWKQKKCGGLLWRQWGKQQDQRHFWLDGLSYHQHITNSKMQFNAMDLIEMLSAYGLVCWASEQAVQVSSPNLGRFALKHSTCKWFSDLSLCLRNFRCSGRQGVVSSKF